MLVAYAGSTEAGSHRPPVRACTVALDEPANVAAAATRINPKSERRMARDRRDPRYRFPTGRLPVSVLVRAGLPDPRAPRGPRRRPADQARRPQAARHARDP